jgi:hypothetical protein
VQGSARKRKNSSSGAVGRFARANESLSADPEVIGRTSFQGSGVELARKKKVTIWV